MKKIITSLTVIAALTSTTLCAQSNLILSELSTGNPAQSHYTFWVGASDPTVVWEFKVRNASSASISSRVHKFVISNATGQNVYFCYASSCYTPSTYYTPGSPIIAAGQTFPTGSGTYGLRTEFDANGIIGSTIVRYTVYDSLNVGDSSNVTITYNVTAAGVKYFNHSNTSVNAYPNPCQNNINFSLSNLPTNMNSGTIKIYGAIGTMVKSISFTSLSKIVNADLSGLEEGMYFFTLSVDGREVLTRKLIVNR